MAETKRDEVSLLDLWAIIVEQRKLIMIVWATCVLLAIVYLLIATPIYQAKAYLLPPTQKDVQPLNIQVQNNNNNNNNNNNSLHLNYTPSEAYDHFVQTLRSRANRKRFYDEHHIADKKGEHGNQDDEVFEKYFYDKLQVKRDVKHKENESFVEVSFEGESAELSAQWVNAFIQQTALKTQNTLVANVSSQVKGLIQALQSEIDGKLAVAKQRRQDRIAMLKEALGVAKVIGQKDRQVISVNGLSMMTDEVPLYLLGEAALQAELDMLINRKDDGPFVEGLRDLQEKLKVLQSIHIDENQVKTMIWDQKALVPDEATKPKKALVMILAMLLGLMLGVMVVFVRQAVKNEK